MPLFYTKPSNSFLCVLCLVAQLCLTLCNPVNCSLPGSSVHEDSSGRNTRVGFYALLQGIIRTQGLNPGLSHRRQILYHLSHQGSPRILEWVAYPFPRGILLTQELNWGLLHCRQILYQLSYQESPLSLIKNKQTNTFITAHETLLWSAPTPYSLSMNYLSTTFILC